MNACKALTICAAFGPGVIVEGGVNQSVGFIEDNVLTNIEGVSFKLKALIGAGTIGGGEGSLGVGNPDDGIISFSGGKGIIGGGAGGVLSLDMCYTFGCK